MGFSYKSWLGPFYPAGMPSKNRLAHYSTIFDTVEIDSTFYGAPRPEVIANWYQTTPENFTFCLKTPKAITHESDLVECGDAMLAFVEPAVLLKEKLGCILLQVAPDLPAKTAANLNQLLSQLPKNVRFAVEFRNDSWAVDETAELLRQNGVCWAAAEYIYMPKTIIRTTDFLYLRFLGRHGQFPTKDKEMVDKTEELEKWYEKIKPHLPEVNTVYSFFNDDYAGFSPASANRFKRVIGLDAEEIRPPQQPRLL
jgi:uncharacterized protein YecE (DUF72 family)